MVMDKLKRNRVINLLRNNSRIKIGNLRINVSRYQFNKICKNIKKFVSIINVNNLNYNQNKIIIIENNKENIDHILNSQNVNNARITSRNQIYIETYFKKNNDYIKFINNFKNTIIEEFSINEIIGKELFKL